MFPASTKGGGMCMTTGPTDVCKIPAPPAPFAPAPFPNIVQVTSASSTASKVKIGGKETVVKGSNVGRSSGDEAGTLKGMVSMVNMDKCQWKLASMKVKAEGDSVVTVLKMTSHNGMSANIVGAQTAPSQTDVILMA